MNLSCHANRSFPVHDVQGNKFLASRFLGKTDKLAIPLESTVWKIICLAKAADLRDLKFLFGTYGPYHNSLS